MQFAASDIRLSPTDLSAFLGCRHRTGLDLGVLPGQLSRPDMLRFARQAQDAGHGLTAEQLEVDANRQAMILWPLTLLGEAAAHVSRP